MYPHERSLVEKLAGKPFAILGVNSDDDRAALKATIAQEKLTWRSFWDGGTEGPIATAWNVQGWPTLYVLDDRGVIRFKGTDGDDKKLDGVIESILKEMGEGKGFESNRPPGSPLPHE